MDPEQIPIRDLHLPAEVAWWPLAPGWWFLLAVAAATLAWLLYRGLRRWRANRARRVALKQLSVIAADYGREGDALATARRVSALLRRALLAYAPRRSMAGLTGDAWLEFLDRGLAEPVFAQGRGRELVSLPYRRPDAVHDDEVDDLLDAVRMRLQTPLPAESR